MSERKREPSRRSYRPVIEGLEALRLLANAAPVVADFLTDHDPSSITPQASALSNAAWDEALVHSQVADLLSGASAAYDPSTIRSGLVQLDRYLSRAWYRSGIDSQKHEDCTQAVYTTLLQNLGRDRFDRILNDVGQIGIREVLSRDSVDGPDFFRIVDTIKKRAQRERVHQPIDRVDVMEPNAASSEVLDRRNALHDAMSRSLNQREAELIQATLQGKTPAEIAQSWGVAPKTVSNEKARAFQKLRDVLSVESLQN